jgi:hypothetical protein
MLSQTHLIFVQRFTKPEDCNLNICFIVLHIADLVDCLIVLLMLPCHVSLWLKNNLIISSMKFMQTLFNYGCFTVL